MYVLHDSSTSIFCYILTYSLLSHFIAIVNTYNILMIFCKYVVSMPLIWPTEIVQ